MKKASFPEKMVFSRSLSGKGDEARWPQRRAFRVHSAESCVRRMGEPVWLLGQRPGKEAPGPTHHADLWGKQVLLPLLQKQGEQREQKTQAA